MTSARVLRFQSRWGFWKGLEPNILGSSRLPSFFFQITLKCKTRCVKVWMDHRTASATGLPLLLTHFLSKCSFFYLFFFLNFKLNTSNHSTKIFVLLSIYTLGRYISRNFLTWTHFVNGWTSFAAMPPLFAQFQADYDCLSDSGDILHFYEYEHVPRLS